METTTPSTRCSSERKRTRERYHLFFFLPFFFSFVRALRDSIQKETLRVSAKVYYRYLQLRREMVFFFTGRQRRRSAWMHVAAVFVVTLGGVASNAAASADRTFPVRKYEDGTIAIVSNHTQITGSRTAFRGDVWLSKINGGKGAYLLETFENTRKLNKTLVSIKAQLRASGCVGNNTKSALFNFTTHEYFNCTCKSGWVGEDCTQVPNYSHLGEGECRESDGSYPIKFSTGYGDLRPHTTGTNAQQAVDRCKAKCIVFAWCLAAEVVLRDIWPTPECRLVTDWNAYVVESTNTFQNNNWGGTQSIDGENYQTYCNGGSSPCSSSNVFNGGSLNSREGYYCYLKTALAPPAPLPPPPLPPSPPPPPPDPDYSYLGEGECRQLDGSYGITFSKGYYDLRPHADGMNAHNAIVRCKAKCIVFAWCLAVQVVLRDIWPTPECRLVTDWNAYVVESTNTFQNNEWGGTQSIDGENYQTYCNGGSSSCSSSNVFDGGKLYSREGYHCYLKTASAPPAPLPPPPSPPSPPPPPPDPDYSYLGEGECRMANGQYSISFNVHDSGSLTWCKDLCLQYTWCLAVQKQGNGCRLITDTAAFITTGGNTFTDDNDKWGATRTFDDKSYTTYCGGSGQAGVCRSVSYEFSGGLLNSRSGYHCYVKK